MKINTDKAYLLGLLIGGGIIHDRSLQIILPYKKWGDLKINPERAGEIAEDILVRMQALWKTHYNMDVSYKIGTDWKVICKNVSDDLLQDLKNTSLPIQGELRDLANLDLLLPLLKSFEHKKSLITGLVDTVGSLAPSHRRFVDDFQVISFEFKGNNFSLVKNVIELLQSIECTPDQVLWNHPNQHSGNCRYYKSWKKGFKIRVCLDEYMLKGGFVFQSKKLSAEENLDRQKKTNIPQEKPTKVTGRVTIHKDEFSEWLPSNLRGGHFVHNLHFYDFFGIKTPKSFILKDILLNFEKYFCPFTCLSKGSITEIKEIIKKEEYLHNSSYRKTKYSLADLLILHEKSPSVLLFGKSKNDGFPLSFILQGIAYIIAASKKDRIKGKRVLGNYINLLNDYRDDDLAINIFLPDRGTCLLIKNKEYAALIGYINNKFNKTLIQETNNSKVTLRNPTFEECILL